MNNTVYFNAQSDKVIKVSHKDPLEMGVVGTKGGADRYFPSLFLSNVIFGMDNEIIGVLDRKSGAPPTAPPCVAPSSRFDIKSTSLCQEEPTLRKI